MSRIGFIGLGNMGAHMTRNLMKGGKKVTVFDVLPASVQQLKADGAESASSPAELASTCKHIVTMLPASVHVKQVYTGKEGLIECIQAGTICMDSSTIDAEVSSEMATILSEKKAIYLDAPVSGGVLAAQNAGLTFMVGGDEEKAKEAEVILKLMGKAVFYCGPAGTGQAAKICNNMLLAISMIGVSEAMALGQAMGLDAHLLSNIVNNATGKCWSSELYNPVPGVLPNVPSSRDYSGGFGCKLMAKDLGLAQNAATRLNFPTPLGSMAHQIYRILGRSKDFNEKDFSSVYKFLTKNN